MHFSSLVQLVFLVLGSRYALGMLLCVVVRSYSVFKHGCVSAYMHCDIIAEHMLVVFRTHSGVVRQTGC